jgi:hypothetical protein
MSMSPVWIGRSTMYIYNASLDGGLTYQAAEKQILFGTFFFLSTQRKIINRDVYTIVDLLAKVGGLYSILRVFFKFIARNINMQALLYMVIRQVYLHTDEIAKRSRVKMNRCEKLTYPLTFF